MTNNQLTDEALASWIRDLEDAPFGIDDDLAAVLAGWRELQERRKAEPWCPDIDPITRYPLFMWIEHPELGCVPTYGGPYDSYTLPERDSNGELFRRRYDHDLGGWREDELIGVNVVEDWLPKDQDELDQYVKDNPPAELQEHRKAADVPAVNIAPCRKEGDVHTHELKVDPIHYAAVVDGLKLAELRLNDRNYQAGDELVLREFDRDSQAYTGEHCTEYVQHVADVEEFATGYVLLSIEVLA